MPPELVPPPIQRYGVIIDEYTDESILHQWRHCCRETCCHGNDSISRHEAAFTQPRTRQCQAARRVAENPSAIAGCPSMPDLADPRSNSHLPSSVSQKSSVAESSLHFVLGKHPARIGNRCLARNESGAVRGIRRSLVARTVATCAAREYSRVSARICSLSSAGESSTQAELAATWLNS